MKTGKLPAALGAALLILSVLSCVSKDLSFSTPDLSAIADGLYRGSCDGGIVKATVDVRMASSRFEEVLIVSHDCGKGKPAEAIVDRVVEEQRLEVDAVSGATYSSKVILKAIENALTGS